MLLCVSRRPSTLMAADDIPRLPVYRNLALWIRSMDGYTTHFAEWALKNAQKKICVIFDVEFYEVKFKIRLGLMGNLLSSICWVKLAIHAITHFCKESHSKIPSGNDKLAGLIIKNHFTYKSPNPTVHNSLSGSCLLVQSWITYLGLCKPIALF